MSIFDKPLKEISKDDLQELKDRDEPESETLDYKLQINKNNPGEKADFCEDVCAFANAEGGFILVGIEDRKENGRPTGKPGEIRGLSFSPETEKRLHPSPSTMILWATIGYIWRSG